jgi:hypothetical protein
MQAIPVVITEYLLAYYIEPLALKEITLLKVGIGFITLIFTGTKCFFSAVASRHYNTFCLVVY